MRFLDTVIIHVSSGVGGDGIVAGRREAGVAFGGPDGGDGGRGGDIFLVSSSQSSTLEHLHYISRYKSDRGEEGRMKQQYGADALDVNIAVPVGTVVREEGRIIYVFTQANDRFLVAQGGIGGWGNMHFKTSVNQYPTFALLGEPGHNKDLELELQLVADVGLIGMPSVGKSSLINSLAHTKVKTADYHFTTLVPHLGVIKTHDQSLTMIDIPGLIQGAAQGKGLGRDFLRHIQKCRIFALIIDAYRYETGVHEMCDVLDEVMQYLADQQGKEAVLSFEENMLVLDVGTYKKYIHILLNKSDMVQDADIMTELQSYTVTYVKERYGITIPKTMIFATSAATHAGLDIWMNAIAEFFSHKKTLTDSQEDIALDPEVQIPFAVRITDQESLEYLTEYGYIDENTAKKAKFRHLADEPITKLVFQIPRGNEEAELRFRETMKHEHMIERIRQGGIKQGDIVRIHSFYAGVEDKWIMMKW